MMSNANTTDNTRAFIMILFFGLYISLLLMLAKIGRGQDECYRNVIIRLTISCNSGKLSFLELYVFLYSSFNQ